ncbi:MAG: beta-ketoacyl-[acyl-carrier-protein] synthase family protein [Candidatus Omnitrophica bacterium]|nr:beta-ketoacyl-[acyl-carrier-protein] synthase family protein [Candidatus Omnitrophota bacterium]
MALRFQEPYRSVVVTGMGVISPIGNSLGEFRDSLRAGRSGEGVITRFDPSEFLVQLACEVKQFRPGWKTLLLDPFIQYSFSAAEEAVKHAGLELEKIDPYRIGIVMGSSKGGMVTYEKTRSKYGNYLPSALHTALFYASFPPHMAAQWIAKRYHVKGPAKCFSTACATGTYSMIEGIRMVAEGEVDYCIAGATDASITKLLLAGYHNMKVYSRKGRMCPYDKLRDGFLIGEGAGVVIFESKESAKARRVPYFAEAVATHYASDGASLIHHVREAHGLSTLVTRLVGKAGLTAQDLDYINTHGTSTPDGDSYEVSELRHALKDAADRIPMSSTKSMTGHMLGASGAVEFIATCLALKEKWIHPTIHLDYPDPECDLDFVPNQFREKKVKTALTYSMAFGGHFAGIVMKE